MTFEEDLRQRFGMLIRDFYWYDETVTGKNLPDGKYSFEDSMQFVFRKENFVFAVKGGHNDEPHNHNDLGSFVFFADEAFLLDDPGWSEYVDGYFGPNRYQHICASSMGHSVPIIHGKAQVPGKEAQTILLGNTENGVTLDCSSAYGETWIRAFSVSDNGVSITDTFAENAEITERLVTRIRPKVQDGVVFIGKARLTVEGAEFLSVSEQTFHPRKNIVSWDMADTDTLYLIDFKVCNDHKCVIIDIEI